MGIEFELKYRADAGQLAAVRKAFSGEETVLQMQTTYYDTPAGGLSARRYTLRRRMENGVAVCTLKTPAGDLGREEYEVYGKTIREAIPELCKLSGVQDLEALAASAEEVCGARFRRVAKTLVLGACTVELALDEGVLTGGGKEMPLREIEVELKSGSSAAAVAFARELAARFGLEEEKRSKFRRALSLAKGE